MLLLAVAARGQTILQGSGPSGEAHLFNTDGAILESQEARKDLPCTATQVKPTLGFDMKFHSGYEVNVPLKELAGSQNLLTMIFRVTPEAHKDEPVYFSQRVNVPEIEENAHGDAYLQGTFDVGEGKYHVDWLMRDRAERVCSAFWDIDASVPLKDKPVTLDILPNTILSADSELFKDEPPVPRKTAGAPLNVKVIVNFAPQDAAAAALHPLDMNALISILRGIAREPSIGRFSIVAFNLQERRIVYRQKDSARIDFPALGEAVHSLNLGTVDVQRLSQKRGETEFLTNLFTEELNASDHPDAVIFAGPKALLDSPVPQESLKKVADVEYPLFYMNYNLDPQGVPWRDAIGNAVKYLKGVEYTITRPRDLWNAWGDIMSRIVKSKLGKRAANGASQ
ncbi:MAG: acetyltransferase [Bryobacteraceae bacterium]